MPIYSEARKKIVEAIFDKSHKKDSTYILASEELLNAHIKFIEDSPYDYQIYGALDPNSFQVDDSGKRPLKFDSFPSKYRFIYARWKHIIRCCYDSNYDSYKYFGAKGIKMSDDFLDSKKFCIWCLKNGVTGDPSRYKQYLVRKDKYKEYSFENCQAITEKELHECKSAALAFQLIYLTKKYQEYHDKSVTYATYYTRYYMYDMDPESAGSIKGRSNGRGGNSSAYTFKPFIFYESVADENSCTLQLFLSHIHEACLIPGFQVYPYDMLRKDYSITAEARKQGLRTYHELRNRNRNKASRNTCASDVTTSVYSDHTNDEIYTNSNGVYS